jgi:two-component system chemotaxis response regulator CheB
MQAHISVLVVDDSAFMRSAITKILEREHDIRVIATARTGEEAIIKAEQLSPDVITMDVEMPGIGGIEAVRAILASSRVPIIMCSSLTRKEPEMPFRALELGAVDFIAKPNDVYANIDAVARDLVCKVRSFARRDARGLGVCDSAEAFTEHRCDARTVGPTARRNYACVAIGTSTGGPMALQALIPRLPENFSAPIVIVQHMPVGFTRQLAKRLNAQSQIHVVEASSGMALKAGTAVLIPSGSQVKVTHEPGGVVLTLVADDGASKHVPSVDIMIEQMANIYGPRSIGVILTGMGQDGVKGLRHLKARGGYVIGQDEATCELYGMPRAAALAGLVDRVAPLDDIPQILAQLTTVSAAQGIRKEPLHNPGGAPWRAT